jgi:hypothetical protein
MESHRFGNKRQAPVLEDAHLNGQGNTVLFKVKNRLYTLNKIKGGVDYERDRTKIIFYDIQIHYFDLRIIHFFSYAYGLLLSIKRYMEGH